MPMDERTANSAHHQHVFKVRPNPAFHVDGAWWTGVILQQACQSVLERE